MERQFDINNNTVIANFMFYMNEAMKTKRNENTVKNFVSCALELTQYNSD